MGIRIDCRRIGELDENTPYVFAGNHQILLDIPLAALSVNRPFGFVAKGELASVPFLGAAIKYSPSIFVDRSNARKTYESIRVAGEQIRGGTSVVIFPEGARSYERRMGPFQKGAFALALEAGVPIVPVTIVDAYNVFNEKRKLARPGVVRVIIGEPISLSSYTRSDIPEIMSRVKRAIESQLPVDEFVGGIESDGTDALDLSDAIP
jgi:1-acyl-sn-glycerol-3-phosphate acyltransferase